MSCPYCTLYIVFTYFQTLSTMYLRLIRGESLRKLLKVQECRQLSCVLSHGTHSVFANQKVSLLRASALFYPCQANYQRRWLTRKTSVVSMNKEDAVPDKYKIIYNCHYGKYLIGTCYILYASLLPLTYSAFQTLINKGYVGYYDETDLLPLVGAPFILALIGGVKFIMSRVFIRIYYCREENSFIALRYTGMINIGAKHDGFMNTRQQNFKQSEVIEPQRDGSFKLRGKTYLVNGDDFTSLRYYNIFMGYDKM